MINGQGSIITIRMPSCLICISQIFINIKFQRSSWRIYQTKQWNAPRDQIKLLFEFLSWSERKIFTADFFAECIYRKPFVSFYADEIVHSFFVGKKKIFGMFSGYCVFYFLRFFDRKYGNVLIVIKRYTMLLKKTQKLRIKIRKCAHGKKRISRK